MKTCKSCSRATKLLWRGCCGACYQRYRHMVLRGETKWHELELSGHATVRAHSTAEWRAEWAKEHPPVLRTEEKHDGERSQS